MAQSIRENDTGKFEQNLTASKVNNIERLLNSVEFVTSSVENRTNLKQQRIRFTNGKYEVTPLEKLPLSKIVGAGIVGAGFALDDKVCFGYKIDGITITIYASEVNGNTVAETDVTPAVGANKVYVRITKANGTALVAVAISVPANDATYRYYWLYDFDRTEKDVETPENDIVTLTKIARPFVIEDGLPNGGTENQTLKLNANLEPEWATVSGLPSGGTEYQVLQRDSSEDAVWNYIEKENMRSTGATQYHVYQSNGSGGVTIGTLKWI